MDAGLQTVGGSLGDRLLGGMGPGSGEHQVVVKGANSAAPSPIRACRLLGRSVERLDRDFIGFAPRRERGADQVKGEFAFAQMGRVEVEDAAQEGVLGASLQAVGGHPRNRVVMHRKVQPFGAGPGLFPQRPGRFQGGTKLTRPVRGR
jgi:hypothetical protein